MSSNLSPLRSPSLIPVLSMTLRMGFSQGEAASRNLLTSSFVKNLGGLFSYVKSFTPLKGLSLVYPHTTALLSIWHRHLSSILTVLGDTRSVDLFVLNCSIR